MNNTTKHSLCLSFILLVGAALYLGGCGPDNLDDPSYLDQINDSGMIGDAADKDADPMMKGQKDEDEDEENEEGKKGGMPERTGMVGEIGVAGVPVVAAVPAPIIELPPQFVELPPEAVTNPPIVTNSAEDVFFNQDIYIEQPVHVFQPAVNQHLIQNHYNQNEIYHTTVINHSSFEEIVGQVGEFTETAQVLPTTVVATPTVYLGVDFVGPWLDGWGWGGPGCAPWLSGGFYRYCSDFPYDGLIGPWVVGPYFR